MSRRIFLIISIIVLGLFVLGLVPHMQQEILFGQDSLPLVRPPFLKVAYAEKSAAASIGEKLDDEAGVSAYFKSPSAIDIRSIRDQFRTIEVETADYIIGSVAITDYPEVYDVHVYAHKDGWMLAYYLKSDPTSKIVDVKTFSLDNTLLRTAMALVASGGGIPMGGISYYDFRYPNATHLLFIAEDTSNGNNYQVEIPSSYGYFERSWSFARKNDHGLSPWYSIDGAGIFDTATYNGGNLRYGILEASHLLPDVPHTVAVSSGTGDSFGVLGMVYRVP